MTADSIRHSIVISAPRNHVFEVLTQELADWWPSQFTFSGDRLKGASIDHFEGGEWFEINDAGEKTSWGTVLEWQAPERLQLSWRVSADRTQEKPENASHIGITLQELSDDSTMLELEQSDFDRHGDGAESMRAGMASAEGWPAILERLKVAAEANPAPDDGHQIF